FNAFNNLISTNKYTQSDLSSYINDFANAADVKKLVTDNLYVSDTIKLDSSQIGTISSNASGIVTINLVAPANIKYTAEENENVTVSNNKITILNLKYYSEVRISSLSNTFNYFQKIITDNNYTSSNFRKYVTNNQSSFKIWFINNSSINVIGGDKQAFSSSDITSVTFNSSEQLVFTLSNVSHRKYSIQSVNDVVVSENVITFSNFNFTINLETYFTWNGNQITGLSSTGKALSKISIPSRATSITNNAFTDNKNLVSIDMSLSNITIFPDGDSVYGLFRGCTALNNIIFPKNLTKIGSYTFYGCSSLFSIQTPDSVSFVNSYAFYNCDNLLYVDFGVNTVNFGNNIGYGNWSTTWTFPTYNDLSLLNNSFIPPNSNGWKYKVRTSRNRSAILKMWNIASSSRITIY
ncbi:MAG: leucine-rich repeat domain-containing protein, partial [Ureaplasma sp.]|nr:leucine-rich repeat domain-containing protein [Ureaplasma sp.]